MDIFSSYNAIPVHVLSLNFAKSGSIENGVCLVCLETLSFCNSQCIFPLKQLDISEY